MTDLKSAETTQPAHKSGHSLAVYSGEVHMGDCGAETAMTDIGGNALRVGDIVMIFTTRAHGDTGESVEHMPSYPTAVVQDEDGRWVMGIKQTCLEGDCGNWRVMRIKRYEDVVEGERWQEYGFNYRAALTRARGE